ncbi:MAG TPA: O-antigen ligase family protein [Bacteroidales bacterium]|nr:O-antigen ligase family protein [Bacteroidales bacterium]
MTSETKYKLAAFYSLAILFIITNCYVIIKEESFLFNLVPLALIVFMAIFLALDKILLFSVFLVPLSVPLKTFYSGLDFNVDLPTEPIFVAILIIFLLKQLLDRDYDKFVGKHPISIAIYIYLGWRFVTVLTSSMPLVSIKYFLASLWFIIPFYFLMSQLFRKENNINKFFWLYIIPFCIVITFTLVKHAARGFSQASANYVMNPFYNDHTSYGAMLAMFIPVLVGFLFNKELKKSLRVISGIVLSYFVFAIIFSYTRAAWISLIGALGVYLILKFKINYKIVLTSIVIIVGLFFVFQDKIFFSLEKNKQDSSTNLTEHIRSISNVATDASNLERINRWNCAVRMFKEKPVFGWGPGTYQFKYAPYQFSYEKTIISTNAGDMGNAHSEYLGALSESGLIGMLTFIFMAIVIFVTAVKNYIRAPSYSLKVITASTIAGLTTYLLHGFMNNFLDTDKAAIPFWGFAAIIVAIDIYFIRQKTSENTNKNLTENIEN